jgi:hypothetical protein
LCDVKEFEDDEMGGHVARMGVGRGFGGGGNEEERIYVIREKGGRKERARCRWVDNIKIGLGEYRMGCNRLDWSW